MVEGRSVFVFIITELYRGKERGGFLISFCIFVFLAVQDSSIGDIVSDSVSQSDF